MGRRRASSPPSAQLVGRREPRIYTEPLRRLTRKTSRGWEVIDFARDVLGEPLLPWQEEFVIRALELNPDGTYRFRVVLGLVARQNGKALDVDTPILTTSGWSTMGALKVGDEVYHPDGHPVRVTEVHPVMRGHPCYRVTTTDGRSIVADAEHLWTVQDRRRMKRKGGRGEKPVRSYAWETLTTEQMLERGLLRSNPRPRRAGGRSYVTNEYAFRLPVQHLIKSPNVPLPVDPYVLGVWLGDGDNDRAVINVGDEDLEEMQSNLRAAGCEFTSIIRRRTITQIRIEGLQRALHSMGLLGAKRVPDKYLAAGTDQRLALLQGLLDTDGSISRQARSTRVEFCSTNKDLANAVCFLARSLGWRATIRENTATIGGHVVGSRWRVCFTPEQGDPVPFRLTRKAARVQPSQSRGDELHAVSIASIEPVESRPVRCIKVDSPDGLFLAGRDLVPTHNTHLSRTVALWRLYVDGARLVLGVGQDVSLAREVWSACLDTIRGVPELAAELDTVRRVNGDEWFRLVSGARYKIAAANRSAGRGLSVDHLIMDEIREQRSWDAWSALSKTTLARPYAQIWAISNAGDDQSIVLNHLREAAMSGRDPSICLLEWSAPDGCELDDTDAWAQANPGLGHTVSEAAIRSALGTDPPAVFRTEVLCQKVDTLDGAVDLAAWRDCADPAGTLDGLRDRVTACVDVAPDGQHTTLAVAAPLDDGRVRLEIAAAWDTTDTARDQLPDLLDRINPRAIGWYPSGPAAALAPTLRPTQPQRNRQHLELKGTLVTEACMGLADLIAARRVMHPDDPLLNAHIAAATKIDQGDGWRFARRGGIGHVDAAYAAAGAVHLALTIPIRPALRPRVIVARRTA